MEIIDNAQHKEYASKSLGNTAGCSSDTTPFFMSVNK